MTRRQEIVSDAIRYRDPTVAAVTFADDGQHVLLTHHGDSGWIRYRLGYKVRAYLMGEFGEFGPEDLRLLAPGPGANRGRA
jgi:hypothetical protein